jgi:diguanylate cyclase (GGDEF)-like protein/PAS domain S-box-containing protein
MDLYLTGYQFTPHTLALILATLVGLVVALVAWRRRPALGAIYLALLELAVAEWAFAVAFETAATEIPLKLLWSKIAYPGTAAGPLFYFLFTMAYSQQDKYLTRRNIALLSIVPALTIVVAVTNDWHRWLWTDISLNPNSHIAIYGHGAWFWAFVAYSYSLLSLGLASLYRAVLRFPAFYKSQIGALLIGSAFPIVGNVMYVFGLNPIPGLDWTPIAFVLSGSILAWGIFRFRILDLVPVARTKLIENMSDGVLVLDSQDRIVDINLSAQQLLSDSNTTLIGLPVERVLKAWSDLVMRDHDMPPSAAEIVLDKTEPQFVDMRISPLHDQQSRLIGRLIVLRDITAQKRVEEALRQANERLRDQLIEIEKLQARLREEAIRDPLTGAFNRRYLEETLVRELAQAQREGRPLSLVMMDIDHFKEFNDTFGHKAGDIMLQSLVNLISGQIRKGDALCRYGGEEFVVVMSNASLENAHRRAEEWRVAFETIRMDYEGQRLQTTISLGVAAYPDHGVTDQELLRAVDRALYAAKAAGRNCTVSAG